MRVGIFRLSFFKSLKYIIRTYIIRIQINVGIIYKNELSNLDILHNLVEQGLLHLYYKIHIDNVKKCDIIKEKEQESIQKCLNIQNIQKAIQFRVQILY